ncbi:di-trans,poly-cis-decaprenylcistransferase [Candidatus Micrarchaeota archaeon CG10_big_fil_rev_8_21_14_0_10_45_29]|nr:MAG: di-trans,poly-cis-decaprenylcistransferase [Candidatus Micrarchaeota archaeon CG10_big_fil_rev_8_21_14_0_10_45_29]
MQKSLSHIAFIPDGNRRWAKKHGLNILRGHEKGIDRMGDVLTWCREEGIKMASFWAFSTENFKRDTQEVSGLFEAFETRLSKVLREAEFQKHKVRVRFIGNTSLFPKKIQLGIKKVEDETKKYDKYFLNFFIGYGGRAELIAAAQKLAKDFPGNNASKIGEKEFESCLWTAGLPDPELIIRTSGESRISGFMPFQSTYSELLFCKKLWPDFSRADFNKAIDEFAKRKRRWGK